MKTEANKMRILNLKTLTVRVQMCNTNHFIAYADEIVALYSVGETNKQAYDNFVQLIKEIINK